jgi:hypothetical protein
VSGVRIERAETSPGLMLNTRMKLLLAGIVNRLNVEHRTSNIERPILMTLRFIDFKTSVPQNFEE